MYKLDLRTAVVAVKDETATLVNDKWVQDMGWDSDDYTDFLGGDVVEGWAIAKNGTATFTPEPSNREINIYVNRTYPNLFYTVTQGGSCKHVLTISDLTDTAYRESLDTIERNGMRVYGGFVARSVEALVGRL